jgi:hypothetical protein
MDTVANVGGRMDSTRIKIVNAVQWRFNTPRPSNILIRVPLRPIHHLCPHLLSCGLNLRFMLFLVPFVQLNCRRKTNLSHWYQGSC